MGHNDESISKHPKQIHSFYRSGGTTHPVNMNQSHLNSQTMTGNYDIEGRLNQEQHKKIM